VFDQWPASERELHCFEVVDSRGRRRSAYRCFWTKPKPTYADHVEPPDLKQLKAAMAAAHPNRGGSSEAFIKARCEYEAAKARIAAA
jgi:hypothetical protein